jgi:hypothetical protein
LFTVYAETRIRTHRVENVVPGFRVRRKIMVKKIFILSFILMLAVFGLAACAGQTGGSSLSAQQTQVMGTVSAVMTRQAFETLVAEATHQIQVTPLPQSTSTQHVPVQITPNPTITATTAAPAFEPTATATPILLPCNAAGFVKDVTVPDGAVIAAGVKFTKTWRLVNQGSCTWTPSYDLVFVDGSAMSAPAAVALSGNVRPGETVDLSVDLVAPGLGGTYKGSWMLRDASDKTFGLGGGKNPFWVSIKVSAYTSDAVPASIYPYDFTAALCQAAWKSNGGMVTLPCPNVSQKEEDWAAVLLNPLLEGKVQEDERAIWMHINTPENWMQAFFPASVIKKGDHFISYIGCLHSNPTCDAVFSLDYRIDSGEVLNLGKWGEKF